MGSFLNIYYSIFTLTKNRRFDDFLTHYWFRTVDDVRTKIMEADRHIYIPKLR